MKLATVKQDLCSAADLCAFVAPISRRAGYDARHCGALFLERLGLEDFHMKDKMTRRRLMETLGATLAATAIVSFDTESRAWASQGGASGKPIPKLDGELLLDAASLAAAADDFGHIVHEAPTAVLVPGSVRDIVEMVKFARKHGIFI